MIIKSEIRAGAYFDSVVLMQLQRKLAALDDVDDAGVVMGTAANKALLEEFELLSEEGKKAKADDLLIVVRAADEKAALDALEQVDRLLKEKRTAISQEFRPRSLEIAVKQLPDASWALISVPGRYAAGVAEQSLDLGLHVFLYSDNVSLEDEVRLKTSAAEKGLLVMGPDCGTAIVNGIGLGFANRVQKGPVGLVGASGTGLQAITSYIHNLGGGVSQAIGTGGRDLKAGVGAITAMQGLDFLAEDEATKVIVIVSKPPSANVVTELLSRAKQIKKPVVVNFIGYPPPASRLGNLHFTNSLMESAQLAVELAESENEYKGEAVNQNPGFLRGLFSGGTLALEAVLGLQNVISPLYTNVPLHADQALKDPLNSEAHSIVDLGEDVFTVGRLHPMIDNDLRIRRMNQEIEDPETGMILLDVVLGEGAHSDPASELTPAIKQALTQRPDVEFVAVVLGTDQDPQKIDEQIAAFEKAEVKVFRNVSKAVEFISWRYRAAEGIKFPIVSLGNRISAINIGLESFYDSLKGQGAEAVHVDWRPPAGGNEKMMDILAKMKK
ncbi:MAG: acyl-CoA synthetase FdrA [Chloroflexota bacterium]